MEAFGLILEMKEAWSEYALIERICSFNMKEIEVWSVNALLRLIERRFILESRSYFLGPQVQGWGQRVYDWQ